MSEKSPWTTPKLVGLARGIEDARLGGPAPNATDGDSQVYVS